MGNVSQTLYECDHPDCDAKELLPEFNAYLPEGWIEFYLCQGNGGAGGPLPVNISKTFCSKAHAVPNIIASTIRVEEVNEPGSTDSKSTEASGGGRIIPHRSGPKG